MNDESVSSAHADNNNHNHSAVPEHVNTDDAMAPTDPPPPPFVKTPSNVPITLNIRYKTRTFPIKCDLYDTLKDLKEQIDKITDVDPHIQKLVNKSITSVKHDDATTTLKDLNITDGQTLLLVGATRAEVLSTTGSGSGSNTASSGHKDTADENASGTNKKEPLSKQTKHEKVLKTGKPDNAQVGIRNKHDSLPLSIDGLYMSMLNQTAKRARLTFKLELDELWINTAETTKKIPMTQIHNVVDEEIEGHAGYSIVGFQTGTTENSIIWIYWCPSQYVKSIRQAILSSDN